MAEMTHDRCSELLRAYVAGELPREDAEAVRAHLGECEDCRAEELAVGTLAAEHEPLTDLESARLHRALAQELFSPRANDDVATPGGGREWKRWIAPALGSAAAVVVALLVITGGLTGGGEDASTSGSDSGAQLELSQGENGTADGGGGGSAGRGDKGKPSHERELSAVSGAATTFDAAGPQPEFDPAAGDLSPEELSEIGRTSDLFQSFSDQYSLDDVEGLRGPFIRRLANSAGDAASQVRECAATLPDDEPILPAYGATGTYDDRDALVLGFVTTDAGSPSLDRYLMWVWTKGSCRQPVDTLFERIGD